jgi:hypothetical protein
MYIHTYVCRYVCVYIFESLRLSLPPLLFLSCADVCNEAVAWISRQIRIPGAQFATQFICFASTRVQILTPEELLCLRNYNKGAGSIKVLNLLALLIQKYKYWRIRWCREYQSLSYVCTCICIYIHTYIHICMHVCSIYACIYIIYIYIYICIWSMYVCMYIYRYTNIHTYIYIYIYIYIYVQGVRTCGWRKHSTPKSSSILICVPWKSGPGLKPSLSKPSYQS